MKLTRSQVAIIEMLINTRGYWLTLTEAEFQALFDDLEALEALGLISINMPPLAIHPKRQIWLEHRVI